MSVIGRFDLPVCRPKMTSQMRPWPGWPHDDWWPDCWPDKNIHRIRRIYLQETAKILLKKKLANISSNFVPCGSSFQNSPCVCCLFPSQSTDLQSSISNPQIYQPMTKWRIGPDKLTLSFSSNYAWFFLKSNGLKLGVASSMQFTPIYINLLNVGEW